MNDSSSFSLFTLRLRHERHVVLARQRARDIARLLGFEHQEQIRLATAASELARNGFRYATGGTVEYLVRGHSPQLFVISVTDSGPGIPNLQEILNGRYVSQTGLGKGIIGTRRLMEHFHITSASSGTCVEAGKPLPAGTPILDAARVRSIVTELSKSSAADPFDEIESQNQELLRTLAELREKQDMLALLNRELEDTNRGVVALYAELDQHADNLRRVSDLKTSFLSNLSHEFRTPLNSIYSLSRLLLSRSDGDLTAEQEKQVTFIQRSASELSELVNDLLDLAKVEAGKTDVKSARFEVGELFGALRGMLRPLMFGNSLELIFESAPDLPPLFTDEGKLSQILRNLISNALKFTPRGHVRVTAQLESPSMVNFAVADTGVGIAPEDQQRIFEEFVQVENEMQGKVKGTGLGLPLSRRLAGLLGGSIEVESEAGVGSIFTVRIPVSCSGTDSPLPSQFSLPEAAGTSILLVEDNAETRFVQEASLKNSNYHLIFATNLDDARGVLLRLKPALIILDRLIGSGDSLPFIGEIRSRGYNGPVLVVSVVDDPEAALSAGANAFLAKPVASFTLLNAVRELIEGKNLKTVLLADDDEVTRYLLGEAIAKMGFLVIEAHNGREAIRKAESNIPDAMVLDIVMPDLSGFEVLREIRSNSDISAMPVIIHSSKDFSAGELETLEKARALLFPKHAFSQEGGTAALRQILDLAGLKQ